MTAKDVWEVGSGWPGLETNIPLMLDQVHKGKLTLSQLVFWYGEKPARMWNIYPKKGSLAVGSDADFVLIEMNKEKVIDVKKLYTKGKFSPFDGWKTKGSLEKVYLRGRLIAEDGRVVGEPRGQMLRPNNRK